VKKLRLTIEKVLGWTPVMYMAVVHDPETKRQSAEWVEKESLQQKNL